VEITEVRVKLMDQGSERLQAFCSITFDDAFVVRDLKIIDGTSGPFVAMPSRKLTSHCSKCGSKNHLRACYCNQCGQRLDQPEAIKDDDGRAKLYADIAHPINSSCREMIQDRVIRAFEEEKRRSQEPGYVSSYDDFDGGDDDDSSRETTPRPTEVRPKQVQTAETPRGPHTAPARQPEPADHGHRPHSQNFGAGILD
jgi:stage V sporulation protein G